jgi:hypothetical protein
MNHRRRFEDVKHAFQHTIRVCVQELQDQHGFSHEHAVQAVLHELVQGIRVEDEMVRLEVFIIIWTLCEGTRKTHYLSFFCFTPQVFHVMKQHGLCWEEALRALAVSRAVEQLTQETLSVIQAVEQLTQRLQSAELWKHRGNHNVQITSLRDVPRKTSQPLSLQLNTFSSSQELATRASDMLTKQQRDKQPPVVESTSLLPIPAAITADFDTTTTTVTHNNNLDEIKTKNSAAKTVARKATTKPETNRKRAAKRSREHEEECTAKRSC